MLRAAQASAGGPFAAFGRSLARAGLICAVFALAGCGSGLGLSKSDIDPSTTAATGVVGGAQVDAARASDEATIRNAVSAADIEGLKGASLPWANQQTGSRGAIMSLVEEKAEGRLCRRFTTSRESFDGVALFRGNVCMVAPGAWQVQGFDPV